MLKSRCLAVAGLIALLAANAVGQTPTRSAYQALDAEKLGRALRDMGMAELLEAYVASRADGTAGDSVSNKALLVETRLSQASQLPNDPEAQQPLYAEAVGLLEEIVDTLEARQKKLSRTNDEGGFNHEWCRTLIDLLQFKLKLGWVRGYERVSTEIEDMLVLLAAEEDRERVIESSADAASSLLGMDRVITDTLESLMSDFAAYGVFGAQLEDLKTEQQYKTGMIALYRAMALRPYVESEAPRRKTLAMNAVGSLRPFLRAGATFEADPWAPLRLGQAYRVAEQWDEADRYFDQALSSEKTGGQIKFLALFEKARSAIEQANYSQADQRIAAFAAQAPKHMADDPASKAQIQWMQALLTSHRFEWPAILARRKAFSYRAEARNNLRRAARLQQRAQDNPAMAERLNAQAKQLTDEAEKLKAQYETEMKDAREVARKVRTEVEKPLMEVVNSYADQDRWRSYFIWAIGRKYRDVEDLESLGTLVLLARATNKRNEGDAESVQEAVELLDTALARDDENAKKLRPLLFWEKAYALLALKKNLQAAEAFAALATEFPDHKLAYKAALNAVKTYKLHVLDLGDAGQPVPNETRLAYIEILKTLLSRFSDKPDVAWRTFDLGEQYRLLSWPTAGDRTEEQIAYARKAVAAFENTPEDFEYAMNARRLALEMRLALLEATEGEPAEIAEKASDLVARLGAYAADAARQVPGAAAAKANALREWGAEAAFQAAVVIRDRLDKPQAALKALRDLIANPTWDGTEALADARAAEIVLLNDAGQQDLAIQKVREFMDQYSAARAETVLQKIVDSIRENIQALRDQPDKAAELKEKRRVYLAFAQQLHRLAAEGDASEERMYAANQLLADALTEAGQYNKALELWKTCQAFGAKRRQARAAELDRIYNARVREAESARTVDALAKQVEAFFEALAEFGIEKELWQEARSLEANAQRLDEVGDDPQKREQLKQRVTSDLVAGWRRLQAQRKEWIPQDITNVRGLARVHNGLDQYDQAIGLYRQVLAHAEGAMQAAAANRANDPAAYDDAQKLYWPLELEFSEMLAEAYADQPERLKQVLLRIKVLQREYPDQGGLSRKFNALRRQLADKVGE